VASDAGVESSWKSRARAMVTVHRLRQRALADSAFHVAHALFEMLACQGAVAHAVVPLEEAVALTHELAAYPPAPSTSVNEALEVAGEVCPAQLPQPRVHPLSTEPGR
jgi:hypothetical protein